MIEKVIDAAIPLWELTLAPLYAGSDFSYFRRIPCDERNVEFKLVEPSKLRDGSRLADEDEAEGQGGSPMNREGESEGGDEGDHSEDEDDEGDDQNNAADEDSAGSSSDEGMVEKGENEQEDDEEEKVYEDDDDDEWEDEDEEDEEDEEDDDEEEEKYKVVLQDPIPFDADNHQMPTPPNFKQLYGEKGRTLQVIVKLANIELTPEKPRYGGGTWHVEGKQVSLMVHWDL